MARRFKARVQIVHQCVTTACGQRDSYGVIVDGMPRAVFYRQRDVDMFLEYLEGGRDGNVL